MDGARVTIRTTLVEDDEFSRVQNFTGTMRLRAAGVCNRPLLILKRIAQSSGNGQSLYLRSRGFDEHTARWGTAPFRDASMTGWSLSGAANMRVKAGTSGEGRRPKT